MELCANEVFWLGCLLLSMLLNLVFTLVFVTKSAKRDL